MLKDTRIINSIDKTVIVAKSGGQFTSIQDGIDYAYATWGTDTPGVYQKYQLSDRIRALESENGTDGSYFYCSEECKESCILYNLHSDPFKDISKPYTDDEYNIWRKIVLEQDDYGCQKCGSKKDLHCHHIIPVKIEPMFALDPDNGIVLCKECHYEIGHKTGTECSTGNLANINCNKEKSK